MAQLLQDIISTGKKQENLYDGFMGLFGTGIKDRNYVPSVDPVTGKVEGASFFEKLRGISDEEKRARHFEIEQEKLKGSKGYETLVNEGLTPKLTTDSTVSSLNKKGADFTETKVAETLARRAGATPDQIAAIKGDGPGYGQEQTDLLYKLAKDTEIEEANKRKYSSPEYIQQQEDRNRRISQEKIDRDRLAFNERQAAELRRDQLIESRETRLGNQELAMLQLKLDENKHNQNLQYQRELDRRKSTENIAAALSSLAMGFFA